MVYGYKVRLDEADLTGSEAVKTEHFYVPQSFAGVLALKSITPDPAPAYLADRWIYTFQRPPAPAGLPVKMIDGKPYIDVVAAAKAVGRKINYDPCGLLLIGDDTIEFGVSDQVFLEAIVTQFDSPEKFANPDLAVKWLSSLKDAGTSLDHASADASKLYDGPETTWDLTPPEKYDLTGFNADGLGSKVPAPGVHPRVFFSPEDIPAVLARLKATKAGQMGLAECKINLERTLWSNESAEGQVFQRLAAGTLDNLKWAAPAKAVSENTDKPPVWLIPQKLVLTDAGYEISSDVLPFLTAAAQYCLITGDDPHGKDVATAIANYFKLREPLLDQYCAMSDTEFCTSIEGTTNGATAYRELVAFAPGNVGVIYDFSAKWMTDDQKALMRRYVAKTLYGRRGYGMNGSPRWADATWTGLDTAMVQSAAAIEGEEGYDPEIYENTKKTVRAWLEYGIDANGTQNESNGKTLAAVQTILESMVVLARRGDNFFGHPHLRKLTEAQVQSVTPDARVNVNNGSYGDGHFGLNNANLLKFFFPQDRCANFLLRLMRPEQAAFENADAYSQQLTGQSARPPLPVYNNTTTSTMLFDADWDGDVAAGKPKEVWKRDDLKLPLSFSDSIHGLFTARSGNDPDATFLMMEARADKWLGSVSFQADAGAFHFDALGIPWGGFLFSAYTAPNRKSLVYIDWDAVGKMPARVKYIGNSDSEIGSFAAADLKNAYDWDWVTQPARWSDIDNSREFHRGVLEPEPDPEIVKCFVGTERYKMRFWWQSYLPTNWMPTYRATWNPVRYAFRTAGVVRGAHSYGLIMDDVRKDGTTHLYEWSFPVGGGSYGGFFQKVDVTEQLNTEINEIALGAILPRAPDAQLGDPDKIDISGGAPRLLVVVIAPSFFAPPPTPQPKPLEVQEVPDPPDYQGHVSTFKHVVIRYQDDSVRYRVLLIPFHFGDVLPKITSQGSDTHVTWKDQDDLLHFEVGPDQRSLCTITRGNQTCPPVQPAK